MWLSKWCVLGWLCFACGCSDVQQASTEQQLQQVGRLHRSFIDANRPDWSGKGQRPLAATFWYPAAKGSVETDWSLQVFQFGAGALNAEFADQQQRPLIVLSHGTGGSAAQLSWLAEALVQQGFVVAAVNHHGNTAAEAKTWLAGFVLPGERARDLSALLDLLLADPELAPHIDATRIGAAGFSLGGYSVLALAGANISLPQWQQQCQSDLANPVCQLPPEADFQLQQVQQLALTDATFAAGLQRSTLTTQDPRIRAVYLMAPALLSLLKPQQLAAVTQPLRLVLSTQDQQILYQRTMQNAQQNLPQLQLKSIQGAGHYVFLAQCNWRGRWFVAHLCHDPAGVDRQQVHAEVAADAAAFFQHELAL